MVTVDDLNEDMIETKATEAASALGQGLPVALEYEPGDATAYRLILTPRAALYGDVNQRVCPGKVIVALVNFGTVYPLEFDMNVAGSNLAAKLTDGNLPSGEALAILFNRIGEKLRRDWDWL